MCIVPAPPSLLVLFKNFDNCHIAETLKRREQYEKRILSLENGVIDGWVELRLMLMAE